MTGGVAIPAPTSAYSLCAQTGAKPAPAAKPSDPGWPRTFSDASAKLTVYQPQIDSWNAFQKITARCAVALIPKCGAKPVCGAVIMEADFLVDNSTRTVLFANFVLRDARYPSAQSEVESTTWIALTKNLFPKAPFVISLDRALTYTDAKTLHPRQNEVSLIPPPIMISNQPAALVIIDGQPIPYDIAKSSLQKIANTNWDILRDTQTTRYYLRYEKSWFSASSLADAWSPVSRLPPSFNSLSDTPEDKDLKATSAAPQPMTVVPLVLITEKPAELIVVVGEPVYQPIAGTQLMWINNTKSDLFIDTDSRFLFLLTSGRWFRTDELKSGKWEPAAATLPADPTKIPASRPRAHVLAAVPGTREAADAVLNASVPVTATADRQAAKTSAEYLGEPEFQPIAGTSVSYASITPNDVLKVGDLHCLCLDGVWFAATTASGPWQTTDKIPSEVYTIPPSSPKYDFGYGVAMRGTGYYLPLYYYIAAYPYYWRPPCYNCGAGAWYNPTIGMCARDAAVYGPYGGYGRAAAYNPRTGAYAWSQTAHGSNGAAASGGFYNPRRSNWSGSYYATSGYQSWGQSVVGHGDQWARNASYSDSRGSVGAAKTSSGGRNIAASGGNGQGFVAESSSGDIYTGKDSNVHKNENGPWYRKSGQGHWNSVDKPTASSSQLARMDQAQSRMGQARSNTQPGAPASATNRSTFEDRASGADSESLQDFNCDVAARSRGNYNADGSSTAMSGSGDWRSRGSGGGGGWASRGASGGGFGSRGGDGGRRG